MVPVNVGSTDPRGDGAVLTDPADRATVHPTQEDAFVRGVSEAVGGPLGEHAAQGQGHRSDLDGSAHRHRAGDPRVRAALDPEVPVPGRRVGQPGAVQELLLHRRAGAVLRRAPQRGRGAVLRLAGRVPGADRLLHGCARPAGARLRRGQPRHQPGAGVLQPQRPGAVRVRHRRHRRRARAAATTALGRGDVRPRPGADLHRDRELGPVRGRAHRVLPVRLGQTHARAGRDHARAGHFGQALPAVPGRAAARARAADLAVEGGRHHRRRRRRPPGCWRTCPS